MLTESGINNPCPRPSPTSRLYVKGLKITLKSECLREDCPSYMRKGKGCSPPPQKKNKHTRTLGSFKRMTGRVCNWDALSRWWGPGVSPDTGLETSETQTSCLAVLKAAGKLAALSVGINEMLKYKGNLWSLLYTRILISSHLVKAFGFD